MRFTTRSKIPCKTVEHDMKDGQIALTVPCDLKYTTVVENSVHVIAPFLDGVFSNKFKLDLRIILNEAFVNAVKHGCPDSYKQTRITFGFDSNSFEVSIKDPGKGILVNEFAPPYPESLIGCTEVIQKTLDGQVMAFVENHDRLKISFDEIDLADLEKSGYLEITPTGGLGISLMTKIMDEIYFEYLGDDGHLLRMVKHQRRGR